MMKKTHKKDGYFTVEAVLIVVVMLFSIFAVMYSFMLIYQYALVQHAATKAAEYGAQLVVTEGGGDNVYSIYSRPTVDDIKKIENVARKELKKSIISSKNCSVVANKVHLDFLWSSGIMVNVKQKVEIPIIEVFNNFGITNIGNFESTGVAEIVNPQETIRNIDLGLDMLSRGAKIVESLLTSAFQFGLSKVGK